MDPNLTIAIPTYNRCRYLEELLPQIISQCEQETGGLIEILVIDNASSDETPILVKNNYGNKVTYLRNKTNIGGDRNFIECIKEAKGKYVWLFGDDEVLNPGGIRRVMNALQDDPDLLIAESDFQKELHFESYRQLLLQTSDQDPVFPVHHTLITKNIFPKSGFDIDFAYARLHTNYGHMYGLVDHLRLAKNIVIFSKKDSAFSIRKNRAVFAETPINLEDKLIALCYYIAEATQYNRLRTDIWLYYKGRPIYKLFHSKKIKRVTRWLSAWRKFYRLDPDSK